MSLLDGLSDIQGVSVSDIADKFGTPFYVYDANIISESYSKLQSFLGSFVHIYYSLKSNPNVSICSYLKKLGANAEVCSLAELENAISAGFDSREIIFVGPLKTKATIEQCVKLGIFAIVCESFEELSVIQSVAIANKKAVNILVRINPDFVAKDALLKMGGKASQFGIDEDVVVNHFNRFMNNENVKVIGVHIYNGTRILDADTICLNTENVFKVAEKIQKKWKVNFDCIDIGGGFGVPYFDNEGDIDLIKEQNRFSDIIDSYLKKYPKTKIIAESGRFLVAKSGYFVSRVYSVKQSKGELFLVTDGGTNCHMPAVGIGSLLKRNFPIVCVGENKTNKQVYNITGPLCTPNDLVGKRVLLPTLKAGDLVAVLNSGAYGPTASPGYFLSHGFPAELMIVDNTTYLIRERDRVSDINGKHILIFD